MSICYYEDTFRPACECTLPVTDQAIQRGVGVFDSIRVYDRRPFSLSAHMDRLASGAESAGIAAGNIPSRIAEAIREGAQREDCPNDGNCLVKAYITGGDVNRRGRFPNPRFFTLFEKGPDIPPSEYQKGIALDLARQGRPFPLVKSINYLFGYMQTSQGDEVMECIYCPGDELLETLTSSFFLCSEGKILTAPVGKVLDGITRNVVLKLAEENGFKTEIRAPLLSELATADEAFLTGSWKEVLPVVRIGEAKVGNGRPGPVAQHLLKLFRSNIDRWLD